MRKLKGDAPTRCLDIGTAVGPVVHRAMYDKLTDGLAGRLGHRLCGEMD